MGNPQGDGTRRNRLAGEKSPYLLQHASNPVDWHPWGDEAFEKARRLDRPLFLSIGYSTCHWCHVMERESFEDDEVARLMNETFVSVKVDREERPDLDHFYMAVCQGLTGSGGWPLTIVMTPEGKPFFAGTYFPRQNRFGRIGMLELVPRIGELWEEKRSDLVTTAEKVVDAVRRGDPAMGGGEGGELGEEVLESAYRQITAVHDSGNGGFGGAPKFPHPEYLRLMLRTWHRTGRGEALDIVEGALAAMRRGGVYDHVGFGFHRYSTDERWLLPHFEKMLYDQALLALVYTEAWQATGKPLYRRTGEEIFSYVLRDLQLEEGGFCSAEDADSEGEEGKFYLWSLEEVREILGPERASVVAGIFHLEEGGNFTDELGGPSPKNIFHTLGGPAPADVEDRLVEEARRELLAARQKRVRPLRDDKVLTDWNGLMIASLARASAAFSSPRLLEAGEKAAAFLLERLRRSDGDLLHRWREGEADIGAHLDDYAFLLWALVELHQASFSPASLVEATGLAERMISLFWDPAAGGFFFSSGESRDLPVRQKIFEDGAVPAGNSVAAVNLLRLARLTGNTTFEEKASELFQALAPVLAEHPAASCHLLGAVDFALGPSSEIVIAAGENGAGEMLGALRGRYLPNTLVQVIPAGGPSTELLRAAPFLESFPPAGEKTTAYVCRGERCSPPTAEVGEVLRLLQQEEANPSPKG